MQGTVPKQVWITDIQDRSKIGDTLEPAEVPTEHHIAAPIPLGEHHVVSGGRGVVTVYRLVSPGEQSVDLVWGVDNPHAPRPHGPRHVGDQCPRGIERSEPKTAV